MSEHDGAEGPLVVGIDGSANARRAMIRAGHLARSLDTALVVVHALGLTEELDGEHVPTHQHRDEIEARVAEWCRDLDDAGLGGYTARSVDGSPVDVLLRTADEHGAAAIVVGRRGAGGRPELRLGSTAHQVVEHARCPVLVIPPELG